MPHISVGAMCPCMALGAGVSESLSVHGDAVLCGVEVMWVWAPKGAHTLSQGSTGRLSPSLGGNGSYLEVV